jgi:glycerophosphoryl diester phosphodiesterase
MPPHQTQPLIFGHRGASAHAPENTLSSFELALAQGAAGIELDAKLSADSEVVVIHDQTVDRTTDGQGKVNQLRLADLKNLDAGSHFSSTFKGERIPTLEEVFLTINRRGIINVELTNYGSRHDQLPELVAALIDKHDLKQYVMISSFYAENLKRFRRQLSGVPVCLLTLSGIAGSISRNLLVDWYQCDGLNPYYSDVTPGLVGRQQRKNRKINAWTVNQPEEIRRLANLHVDGIITDSPISAYKALRGSE